MFGLKRCMQPRNGDNLQKELTSVGSTRGIRLIKGGAHFRYRGTGGQPLQALAAVFAGYQRPPSLCLPPLLGSCQLPFQPHQGGYPSPPDKTHTCSPLCISCSTQSPDNSCWYSMRTRCLPELLMQMLLAWIAGSVEFLLVFMPHTKCRCCRL